LAVLIKICGLTRRGDAEAAIAAGADLVGFVLVPGTPRFVRADDAGWIGELSGAAKVGVFRDQPADRVEELRERLALDWVQLHGDEPEEYLIRFGPRVIRRVRPAGERTWLEVERVSRHGLPLLDPGAGDGAAWSWDLLPAPPPGLRFGIAGGLGPASVAGAVAALRPALVDVSSGVEVTPGVKDRALVAAFIHAARQAGRDATIEDTMESR
jgi:phosphoribosylanthranilate isomerase